LIKEKAHLSIRKKKLKGLRAAGQKQHTKLHDNTYKIKNKNKNEHHFGGITWQERKYRESLTDGNPRNGLILKPPFI